MKEEIQKILYTELTIQESERLTEKLFALLCKCDNCKQKEIDDNYRKYIELNKNIKSID